MDLKRFTGPQAGSQKYDLLTALAVAGLNGTPGFQTSMMRLIAVVTARYNWRNDELTVGQKELAKMWSVNERTVKREMKRLTASQVLVQLRAGVRGCVAAYRLNYHRIFILSQPVWENVGPDFSSRMSDHMPNDTEKVVRVNFGTPIAGDQSPDGNTTNGRLWDRLSRHLSGTEPDIFRNWFSELNFISFEDDVLKLNAPNKFVAQYIETYHTKLLWQAMAAEEINASRIEFDTVGVKGSPRRL